MRRMVRRHTGALAALLIAAASCSVVFTVAAGPATAGTTRHGSGWSKPDARHDPRPAGTPTPPPSTQGSGWPPAVNPGSGNGGWKPPVTKPPVTKPPVTDPPVAKPLVTYPTTTTKPKPTTTTTKPPATSTTTTTTTTKPKPLPVPSPSDGGGVGALEQPPDIGFGFAVDAPPAKVATMNVAGRSATARRSVPQQLEADVPDAAPDAVVPAPPVTFPRGPLFDDSPVSLLPFGPAGLRSARSFVLLFALAAFVLGFLTMRVRVRRGSRPGTPPFDDGGDFVGFA